MIFLFFFFCWKLTVCGISDKLTWFTLDLLSNILNIYLLNNISIEIVTLDATWFFLNYPILKLLSACLI